MASLLGLANNVLVGESLNMINNIANNTNNTSRDMHRVPRLPVFLYAPALRLVINLPFAPKQLRFEKKPNYEYIKIPGYHTEIPIYTGAGLKKISFEAKFEHSRGSALNYGGSGQILMYLPSIGVIDLIAQIEQFIYPPKENLRNSATDNLDGIGVYKALAGVGGVWSSVVTSNFNLAKKALKNPDTSGADKFFYAPPVCYFVFGLRYWKCLIESADYIESNYNRLMIPTHLETTFTLTILEDGKFFNAETNERDVLSAYGSTTGVLDIALNVISAKSYL